MALWLGESEPVPRAVHAPAYKRFLRRLRAAREEAGLTQVEVARALKKPQSWVSKSESGERRLDPVEFRALARLYGRTMDAFFDR